VDLERGPLSLVSTIEDLLGRESSGFGLENQEYGRRDPSRWPRDTPLSVKLALTSPTDGGRHRYSSLSGSGHEVCFVLFDCYFNKESVNFAGLLSQSARVMCTGTPS
jgi:hypothetical protein